MYILLFYSINSINLFNIHQFSTTQFEKYCAPILNLGGLCIDIVKTDSEGHARRYVEELDALPHAIVCAGGDGTLSEIVTGETKTKTKKNISKLTSILRIFLWII